MDVARPATKRCPFCAEEILSEAIVCKHCGRDLVPMAPPVPATPPPPPPAAYAPPPPTRTNGMAIAALVLGIVWVYGVGSVLALVFGYSAKAEIDRSGGAQTGRGMAVAGIVLGWVGVGLIAFGILVALTSGQNY